MIDALQVMRLAEAAATCDRCGKSGAELRRVTLSHGNKKGRFTVELCPTCLSQTKSQQSESSVNEMWVAGTYRGVLVGGKPAVQYKHEGAMPAFLPLVQLDWRDIKNHIPIAAAIWDNMNEYDPGDEDVDEDMRDEEIHDLANFCRSRWSGESWTVSAQELNDMLTELYLSRDPGEKRHD